MKLTRYLATHRISQVGFAAQLGVSRITVSYWCNQQSRPRSRMMVAIALATKGAVTAKDFRRQRRRRVE